MINASIERKPAVPLWAAFGAPLVGVPLLVGLLALGRPHPVDAKAAAPDAGIAAEQVEPAPVEAAIGAMGVSVSTEEVPSARC